MKCPLLDWESDQKNSKAPKHFETNIYLNVKSFDERNGKAVPCVSEVSSLPEHKDGTVACPCVRVLSWLTSVSVNDMDLLTEFVAASSKLWDIGLPEGCLIASERLWPSSLATFCRVLRLPACDQFVWFVQLRTAVFIHSTPKSCSHRAKKTLTKIFECTSTHRFPVKPKNVIIHFLPSDLKVMSGMRFLKEKNESSDTLPNAFFTACTREPLMLQEEWQTCLNIAGAGKHSEGSLETPDSDSAFRN